MSTTPYREVLVALLVSLPILAYPSPKEIRDAPEGLASLVSQSQEDFNATRFDPFALKIETLASADAEESSRIRHAMKEALLGDPTFLFALRDYKDSIHAYSSVFERYEKVRLQSEEEAAAVAPTSPLQPFRAMKTARDAAWNGMGLKYAELILMYEQARKDMN